MIVSAIPLTRKENILNWTAVISGHFFERYEVMTFSFFIPILTPLFFPVGNAHLATLAGMATFAAGYFARPLGGLIFGHIGDRLGRKVALLSSILCVTIPTLILGFLPTYEKIGLMAPFILIICRVIQGISVGGEYSGATVFFYEYAKASKQGFSGGIMCATAFLGGVLGTLIGSISTYMFESDLGWRLPFIIGGTASLLCFTIRRHIVETPVFTSIKTKRQSFPFRNVLINGKKNMLKAMFIGAQGHMLLYTITIYFNSTILKGHQISEFMMMMLNTIILSIWVVLFLVFGNFADTLSKKWMIKSMFLGIILFSPPLFWILSQHFSFVYLAILEGLLCIFGAGMFALAASYLPSLFNPEERYSGVAVGQTLGQAILGGTAPLIATFLSTWVGEILAPLFLLVTNATIGLLLLLRE